jgi:response regulator RpfG family c-di-GMP phosphodiesterase
MKILCVEHYPACLTALQCKLENTGYEVIPASNGQQAVSLFSVQTVDGVPLEYDLPDKTGTSVREEMNESSQTFPFYCFQELVLKCQCSCVSSAHISGMKVRLSPTWTTWKPEA